jgi:two-component system, cell cycle sensor histidine kinase and response regulator CckA
VRLDLGSHVLVYGDSSQLRQVIMNLLINAADAIGHDKGTIDLAVRNVDKAVVLSVTDDVCGMDEVTRQRALEPFYTTKFTGRGLGLSAVLGIVRAHEGELSVDSELGVGKVLVVDDDEHLRAVGQAMLEALGYDVELAADGVETLSTLGESSFDAVVLDLVMPRMKRPLQPIKPRTAAKNLHLPRICLVCLRLLSLTGYVNGVDAFA